MLKRLFLGASTLAAIALISACTSVKSVSPPIQTHGHTTHPMHKVPQEPG
jgi:hypothetical protein